MHASSPHARFPFSFPASAGQWFSVPPCVTGGPYVALSHQHTIAAIKRLRDEAIKSREALPTWMCSVTATIVARNLPLHIRQMISGGDQNRDAAVTQVRISRVIEMILQEVAADHSLSMNDAIKLSIQKTGFRTPTTSKQLEEWHAPAYWAHSCASVAVEALKRLEAGGMAATLGSLRCMRPLVTPEARLMLAHKMLGGLRNQAALEAAARDARHQMLVDMHWRRGNPNLDDEKGMPPRPCAMHKHAWWFLPVGAVRVHVPHVRVCTPLFRVLRYRSCGRQLAQLLRGCCTRPGAARTVGRLAVASRQAVAGVERGVVRWAVH